MGLKCTKHERNYTTDIIIKLLKIPGKEKILKTQSKRLILYTGQSTATIGGKNLSTQDYISSLPFYLRKGIFIKQIGSRKAGVLSD